MIGLLDPDGLGDETDFLALEQGAMVLATEMFRLRSVAANELRVWGDLASDLLDNPDFERSRSHAGGLGYSLDRPHRALVIAGPDGGRHRFPSCAGRNATGSGAHPR